MKDFGTTKYMIRARIEANGVVERPDVVGAIFGQTEGLLGNDLDLRELQKTSRIGRIKVNIESVQGISTGTILIPSSLDKTETSIIAASLETIDRIGPCEAKIKVEEVEDVREAKRKFIVDRAKEILDQVEEKAPESLKIAESVKEHAHLEEITAYKGLPAGPSVRDSDAILVVEGRADVLNLLRHGIKNAIAVEGTSVPPAIIELSRDKTVTAFLDGDRGGDLILKELLQIADIDFIARAPPEKGVQNLTRKEIIRALRNKIPVEQAPISSKLKSAKAGENGELDKLREIAIGLSGTLKAWLLNDKFERIDEVEVRDLAENLARAEGISAVVFDGVVTQKLVDVASQQGLRYLVGMQTRAATIPPGLKVKTLYELTHSQ